MTHKGTTHEEDQDFVGLDLELAQELATQRSVRIRVIQVDGQNLPATRDYRTDRLNCTVANALIVKVGRG